MAATLFATSTQGGLSTDEEYRYQVEPTGVPILDQIITGGGINEPQSATFDGAGRLFVVNRGPNSGGGGSISRFLSPAGQFLATNAIISASFSRPHWAVVWNQELFVVNTDNGNVLRFLFGGDGSALANGSFTAGLAGAKSLRGITAAPWGEILVTECCGSEVIHRFLIDVNGTAIPNGTITGGLSNPHDMAFSPWGELFVANFGNNTIARFAFNGSHQATTNGQLTASGLAQPIGVSFSPWGELFVASHSVGRIWRWTFDAGRHASTNGFFTTPNTLGDVEFLPEVLTPIPTGFLMKIR